MAALPHSGFGVHAEYRPAPPIGLVGVLGGCADLGVAAAYWLPQGVEPIRIPQSIAAWMLGRDLAIAGGALTASMGIALYCYLTTLMVALYVSMSRRHAFLVRRPLISGAIYGAALYPLLFKAIVPLWTGEPASVGPLSWDLVCTAAFIFFIGIPAALCARLRVHDGR